MSSIILRSPRWLRASRPPALLVAALLSFAPAIAQTAARAADAPAADPAVAEPAGARFLVEDIRIEGLERARPDLLLAESRLRRGETYSEAELVRAVGRIDRLPFILAAELALERGSQRGAYVLVVTVREAERWFFGADGQLTRFDQDLVLNGRSSEQSWGSGSGTAGLRFYLGTAAVAFVAADDREGLKAGLTHYDLFGKRINATLAVSRQVCCRSLVAPLALDPRFVAYDLGDATERASLGLALPLTGSQSLRLDASELESDLGLSRAVFPADGDGWFRGELVLRRVALRWVLDTTDDFLLPSTGVTIAAGLEHQALSVDRALDNDLVPLAGRGRERLAVVFDGRQVFRLGQRSTLLGSAQAAVGRAGRSARRSGDLLDPNAYELAAALRHSYDLLGPTASRRHGDLRFELGGELGWERAGANEAGPSPILRATLSTGLLFRNAWGVFRLGFAYTALERDH